MSDPLRQRQTLLARSTIAAIDKILDDAAKVKRAVPGLLEARDALQFCITQTAIYDELESDHSCYAEQSLLGALILDGSSFNRICENITDNDFALDYHRRIFRHIAKIVASGDIPDVVLVYESIEASNEVDQVGGLSYIGEIAANTPSSANIEAYARIVRTKADKRRKLEKLAASV